MKKIILAVLFTSSIFCYGQDVLTNKTILELKGAGIPKSTIQSMIETSACNFSTGVTDIIALKKAGIDEEVVNAMIAKMNKQKTSGTLEGSSQVVTLLQKLGSGLYYQDGDSLNLKELEPTVYSQTKTGSGIIGVITYGIGKTKQKMSVSGEAANLQVTEKRPRFFFYFSSDKRNLNDQQPAWFASATNPNEFMLIKFDINKKSSREVTVGTYSEVQGQAAGIDDDQKRSFKFKKLSPGVYEVYLEKDLETGEYCFMYAGNTAVNGISSPKVYDFGINKRN